MVKDKICLGCLMFYNTDEGHCDECINDFASQARDRKILLWVIFVFAIFLFLLSPVIALSHEAYCETVYDYGDITVIGDEQVYQECSHDRNEHFMTSSDFQKLDIDAQFDELDRLVDLINSDLNEIILLLDQSCCIN